MSPNLDIETLSLNGAAFHVKAKNIFYRDDSKWNQMGNAANIVLYIVSRLCMNLQIRL